MEFMKDKKVILTLLILVLGLTAGPAMADPFGTGENQFSIDFTPISGATNPDSGQGVVNNDYRISVYEVTNDQWTKFTNIFGIPTGAPASGYDQSPPYAGANLPTGNTSWLEACQFVNWLINGGAKVSHVAAD